MLDLTLPWWEFIVRAAAVYGVLLVMVRMSGKRTIGQFTPFDLLVVMLLSEAVSNSLGGGDESLVGGLIGAATLLALNAALGRLTAISPAAERLVDGEPVLLGRDGRLFRDRMRRHRVGEGDMARALREADCGLDELNCAFLEIDGSISVRKRERELPDQGRAGMTRHRRTKQKTPSSEGG